MLRDVARRQVLVQLDDAQVGALDELTASIDQSRSEVIRRAIDLYLAAAAEAVQDLRYAAAYERMPEDPDEGEAMLLLAASTWPAD